MATEAGLGLGEAGLVLAVELFVVRAEGRVGDLETWLGLGRHRVQDLGSERSENLGRERRRNGRSSLARAPDGAGHGFCCRRPSEGRPARPALMAPSASTRLHPVTRGARWRSACTRIR